MSEMRCSYKEPRGRQQEKDDNNQEESLQTESPVETDKPKEDVDEETVLTRCLDKNLISKYDISFDPANNSYSVSEIYNKELNGEVYLIFSCSQKMSGDGTTVSNQIYGWATSVLRYEGDGFYLVRGDDESYDSIYHSTSFSFFSYELWGMDERMDEKSLYNNVQEVNDEKFSSYDKISKYMEKEEKKSKESILKKKNDYWRDFGFTWKDGSDCNQWGYDYGAELLVKSEINGPSKNAMDTMGVDTVTWDITDNSMFEEMRYKAKRRS